MPTLVDYEQVVDALIQDQADKLDATARQEAIAQAVQEHTRIKPWVRTSTVTGTASAAVSLPTGWQRDVSMIQSIEYPVGELPPTYLEAEDWFLKASPTASAGVRLWLTGVSPATSETLTITWTAPHVVSAATSSIPEGHFRAVATLGASYACLQLAGFYAQAGDATIAIDSQDPRTKSDVYRSLARDFRARYRTFFGLPPDDQELSVPAASIIVDLDRNYSWGGNMMFHPRRWR